MNNFFAGESEHVAAGRMADDFCIDEDTSVGLTFLSATLVLEKDRGG
jgi:hypothetical protein